MSKVKNLPILRISTEVKLPSNSQWENRFEIKSESSDRIYIVAQNIKKRHWGCSCPSYRIRRYCKHLAALGLPAYEKPFEVKLVAE